jgi:uroporphyrinogen-III decarboxylase
MVFLHVCGDSRHILDLMARSGADCLEIDEAVDLATALKVADGSVCIRGNLRTTLFLDGTKEEVLRQARNCVRLGEGKRYILSAGCGIPRLARIESLAALREAVEKPW